MEPFEAAVQRLCAGGLVAFPTETVWGLGADATSPEALARLLAWKGRSTDQPIAVLVEGLDGLEPLGVEATPVARALAEAFWPGPLTLVVPTARSHFAPGVGRADGAVGLRCSPDPTAMALVRALARAGAGPLTATSLNRHGEPSATSQSEARALCAAYPGPELVAPLADSGPELVVPLADSSSSHANPSTVVDCTGPTFQLIREGAIAADAVAAAVHGGPAVPTGVEASR
ncbi:MAG: L-threonylcarbamoyladenylate synthase [Deltaproteobacteria bacterium]|nr:L-threonylcarbamoyladenylate synthase [Deltaproteobacteria bacterium]MBW2447515.1 L-threonylcarbamoyladenylate synthase [Deltaproteobacteria bacterium]